MRIHLKQRFIELGRSQRSIALMLGMREQRLSNIVRGVVDPAPAEIDALARMLEIAPAVRQRIFASTRTPAA